ncbi:MAG: NAD(+) synthase [Eubacteriales bacterium]|jgi:NAD+ synthase (glutamine-hydrolysing)
MKDGFIKAATAAPKISVADCAANSKNIIRLIDAAFEKKVSLLVLPELCVAGYTCGDLFLSSALIANASKALVEIADATKGKRLLVFVGIPIKNQGRLYNCAAAVFDGRLLGLIPKMYLPNCSGYSEPRWFDSFSGNKNTEISVEGFDSKIPFGTKLLFRSDKHPEISIGAELGEDLLNPIPPSLYHAAAGASIIVNLSASYETVGKAQSRRLFIENQSKRFISACIFSNAGDGESTTDMVFSGHSLICENGTTLAEREPFSENADLLISEIDSERLIYERRRTKTLNSLPEPDGYTYIDVPFDCGEVSLTRAVSRLPFLPANMEDREDYCEMILTIQSRGLAKRIESSHAYGVVIGISGGLDSTLALLVSVRAMKYAGLKTKDITAVTMPCFGTTSRTKTNAEILCKKLGVSLRSIDIKKSVEQHFADIGHNPDIKNSVFENAQARERTQILMDIANQVNALVVGTGDLSELALGWTTYNGDHMSMYGVNSSVPKTLVKYMIGYAADSCGDDELSAVLNDILDTPVSPELLPADNSGVIAQKTEDFVGPYELNDFFLYYTIKFGFSPEKIRRLAYYSFDGFYTHEIIDKWLKVFLKRFFAMQFKRSCLPDGPVIGSISLSPRGGWCMPSDASSNGWIN